MSISDDEVRETIERCPNKTAEEVLKESLHFVPRVLYADFNDKQSAILVIDRHVVPEDARPPFALKDHCYVVFQIAHTDVKRLSNRNHLIPLDNDTRRPMFASAADDFEQHQQWLHKNLHLFLAYENVTIEYVAGRWVVFKQYGGQSNTLLHKFHVWCAHVMGHPVNAWCLAQVKVIDEGNALVMMGDEPSVEDFAALVRGKKTREEVGFKPMREEWTGAKVTDASGQPLEFTTEAIRAHTLKQYQEEILQDHEGPKGWFRLLGQISSWDKWI